MEIIDQRQQLKKLINDHLDSLNLPVKPRSLYDPVRYTLSLPGKRVRPYLTLVGCGLCGGEVEEALPAAISIELLHNFTLLHDDIMDGADTRRGAPSVFKKWSANTAILSGDVMYAKAFKRLQYYGQADEYLKESYAAILDLFLESAEKVCEGQAYDLSFEKKAEVTVDDYLHMISRKTGALLSGALAMGGAVAGAEEEQIDHLKEIGEKAGIAFQIQDDLLDAVGDPKKVGKTRGGDIKEGKKTYLTLLSLQRGNRRQKDFLTNVLTSGQVSQQDISDVIDLYNELKVLEDTKEAISYYYQSALDQLEHFTSSPFKEEVTTFFNTLISREY